MDMTRLQQLVSILRGSQQAATPAALGSGMAQQAAQTIQSRPYQLHVQEAQALGKQPMTPEQFASQAGQ